MNASRPYKLKFFVTNLKEFETESSETVKIQTVETVETEDETEEVEFEISTHQEEEKSSGDEGEVSEEDEPISISIDEPKVEMEVPSKNNESAAIEYTKVKSSNQGENCVGPIGESVFRTKMAQESSRWNCHLIARNSNLENLTHHHAGHLSKTMLLINLTLRHLMMLLSSKVLSR